MLSQFNIPAFSAIYKKTILPRAQYKWKKFGHKIASGSSILDVGCGHGGIYKVFNDNGYKVTAVDVEDASLFEDCTPLIIENETLPFESNSFDYVLLITVLHHVENSQKLLLECARVGKRVLVMEDTYSSKAQRKLTEFVDSLVNWHWKSHPHHNLSFQAWLRLFSEHNFKVLWHSRFKTAVFFEQACFLLETEHL